jgi:hypothetical protein
VTEISPSDVWVAGNTGFLSDPDIIGHWDGSNLTMTGIPGGAQLNGIAAVNADDVWAVGYVGCSTLVEHWDGTSWAQVTSPNPSPRGNQLFGISAAPDGSIWAVGRDNPSFFQPIVQNMCPG